jgi:hypothetical protein
VKITGTTTLSQLEERLRMFGLGLSVQFVASERVLEAFVTDGKHMGSAQGSTLDEAIDGAIAEMARSRSGSTSAGLRLVR